MLPKKINKHSLFFKLTFFSFLTTSVFTGWVFMFRQIGNVVALQTKIQRDLDAVKKFENEQRIETAGQISLLREELIKYKLAEEEKTKMILGASSGQNEKKIDKKDVQNHEATGSVAIVGLTKLRSGWKHADVFVDKKASSRIVGQIVSDHVYFVYEKNSDWLKIDYQIGKFGFVQSDLMQDI